MSTTTFRHGLQLDDPASSGGRHVKPFAYLREVWTGVAEGFAAARRYHELTHRGLSHEEAASKVFFEHYQGR